MNHQDLYKLLKTIQKNVRCPQCGKQYIFESIDIKGIIDSMVFLELHCPSHSPLVATVAMTKQKRKANEGNVTNNDVIETYKFLKNFNGGFEKVFKENNKK